MHDDCAATMVYIGRRCNDRSCPKFGANPVNFILMMATATNWHSNRHSKCLTSGISVVRDVSALSFAIPVVPATAPFATSTGLYFFRLVM